jgi:hypothetical protein
MPCLIAASSSIKSPLSRVAAAATARLLAHAGATIAIGFNTSESRARDVLSELPGSGHSIVKMSLEDIGSIRGAARALSDRYPKLDIVVNSADFTEPILLDYAVPHAETAIATRRPPTPAIALTDQPSRCGRWLAISENPEKSTKTSSTRDGGIKLYWGLTCAIASCILRRPSHHSDVCKCDQFLLARAITCLNCHPLIDAQIEAAQPLRIRGGRQLAVGNGRVKARPQSAQHFEPYFFRGARDADRPFVADGRQCGHASGRS